MTLQQQRKALLAALLLSLGNNVDAVTSDSNCQCATARSSAATPNYNASVLAGCRFDVGEQVSAGQKWCLTNQSTSTPGCGQFIQYIGWVDQCDQAKFTFFGVGPSQKLEWDQDPTEFYQGQNLNLVWASSHIDEAVKITYYNNANSLRSIVPSTPGNAGSYSRTTSTASNNDLAVNVPLILQTASSTSDWNATSNVTVSFLANKLTGQFGSLALATDVNGVPLDTISNGVLGGGDIKVSWRNVGLLSGSTSMQIKRSSGNCFGCSGAQTVTATLGNNTWQYDNVAIGGNPTGNSTTYYIVVTNGGYTVNTQAFFFKVPTPTATGSATASRTSSATASSSRSAFPTSTATSTKTATGTATGTATASGSVTASGTPTPSNTETARASIDVAAIAAAAAEKNAGANAGAIAGAVVGTCVVILVAVVAYNVWNKKRLRSLRDRRRVASAKWATDSSAMNKAYGIREEDLHDVTRPPQQTVVMYTVNVGNGGLPGGPARGGSGSSLTTTPSRSGYAPTGKLGRGSSKGSMR